MFRRSTIPASAAVIGVMNTAIEMPDDHDAESGAGPLPSRIAAVGPTAPTGHRYAASLPGER